MTRPVLIKYPMVFDATTADLDTLLMDIRAQENLLQGLNKAQPWVDELARVSDMVFDRVNDNLEEVTRYLESSIDSANAEFVKYCDLVQQLQNNTFQGMVYLGQYRRGDGTAVAPDLENYRKQQQELDDLYINAKKQLRKSRITVIVWSRTHRDLARGIVEPAKVNIFDLTKKAVDTAL
jgi:hypothetical protein